MTHAKFPRQMPAPCVGCGLAWPTPTRFCGACGTKIDYVWVCDVAESESRDWDTHEFLFAS